MATTFTEGRRLYIKTQYGEACVPDLKSAGVHWDGDKKAWWISTAKQSEITAVLNRHANAAPPDAAAEEARKLERDRNNIVGRASYNGQSYYLLGEGTSARGPWVRLLYRDGSKAFFAKEPGQVEIKARYANARTLAGLQEFAARKAREAAGGPCECRCHNNCACGTGFCSLHHDGCDYCGCEA